MMKRFENFVCASEPDNACSDLFEAPLGFNGQVLSQASDGPYFFIVMDFFLVMDFFIVMDRLIL